MAVLAVEVGVVVVGEDAGGVSGDESLQLSSSGRLLLPAVQQGGDDFRIERRVGALAGKVGVHVRRLVEMLKANPDPSLR